MTITVVCQRIIKITQNPLPMRTLKFSLSLLALIVLVSSCVTRKVYDEALLKNSRQKKTTDSLRIEMEENRYAKYDLQRQEIELKEVKEKLADTQSKLQNLKVSQNDFQKRYDELLEQNKILLSNSSSDVQKLTQQLSEKQAMADANEREVIRLREDMRLLQLMVQEKEAEVSAALNADHSGQYEAQIRELQTALQAKDNALGDLRGKLNQALHSFSASDLTVSEANGKIYVSLSQNLLFASGSDRIDWKGKQAIQKLAGVLNGNPDVEINVEGHTDSDGSAAQNWELSTRRANSVVQVLTANSVDPKRIIASGRAFYFPIASNSTAAGKAKNRRTEIILSPKLDKLYELINN